MVEQDRQNDTSAPQSEEDLVRARFETLLRSKTTRRNFLKGSAAIGASALLSSCGVFSESVREFPSKPERKYTLLWVRDISRNAVDDGESVFINDPDFSPARIDVNGGTVEWRNDEFLGNVKQPFGQNLILLDGQFVDRNHQVGLVALDKTDGKLNWQDESLFSDWPTIHTYQDKLIATFPGDTRVYSSSGELLFRGQFRLRPHELNLEGKDPWIPTRARPLPEDEGKEVIDRRYRSQFFNIETLELSELAPPYGDGNIYAFRVRDNIALFTFNDPEAIYNNPDPGQRRARIGAYDMNSGMEIWSQDEFEFAKLVGSVAIGVKDLGIESDKTVIAGFDFSSGEQLWEKKFRRHVRLHGDEQNLYLIQTKEREPGLLSLSTKVIRENNIVKLDPNTGEENWDTTIPGGEGLSGAETGYILAWEDEDYFVIANSDDLYVIDSQSGRITGKVPLVLPDVSVRAHRVRTESSLTDADSDRVYIGISEHLFSFNRSDGSLHLEEFYGEYKDYQGREKIDATYNGRKNIHSVDVVDGLVLVNIDGKELYCYKPSA